MRTSSHSNILLAATLILTPVYAATLDGVISDPDDKPIPYSRVRIFARDRQEQITAVTDDQGRYHIESIAPGEYLVLGGKLARLAMKSRSVQPRPLTVTGPKVATGPASTVKLTSKVCAA